MWLLVNRLFVRFGIFIARLMKFHALWEVLDFINLKVIVLPPLYCFTSICFTPFPLTPLLKLRSLILGLTSFSDCVLLR
jgi:hypothetical protein